MKLRDIIKTEVKRAVEKFDFSDYIAEEINNINIEALIENKLEKRLEDIDFQEIIEDAIDDVFDEEFDEYEISEIIKSKLED